MEPALCGLPGLAAGACPSTDGSAIVLNTWEAICMLMALPKGISIADLSSTPLPEHPFLIDYHGCSSGIGRGPTDRDHICTSGAE